MLRNRSFVKRAEAVSRAVCETLETRWLLATYEVPAGNTSAYLDNGQFPGQVVIRLNSPTANPVPGNPFGATTGQHVLDAGTNGTTQNPFLVVDRVWARWKPQAGGTDPQGVKVQATQGGHATLRIESNNVQNEFWDRQYIVFSSTSNNTRIDGYHFPTFEVGQTHIGEGVSSFTIRTNDVQASEHFSTALPLPTNPGSRVVVQNLVAGVHLTVDTGQGTYNTIQLGMDTGGFNPGFLAEEATVITGGGNCRVVTRGIDLDDQHTRARVDFGDGSGTGNNFLDVQQFSTTTLAEAPGTDHVIVLEHAQVGASALEKLATLLVEDESQVLDLDVNAHGVAKVLASADGTEVPDFTVALNGKASIQGESTIGLFTIEGEVEFLGVVDPNTIKQSTVNKFEIGATSVTTSNGQVKVDFNADVTALTASRIGALEIATAGKLTLQAGTADLLTVRSLYIFKGPTAADGVLDLTDNAMIIDYSGNSPFAAVRDYIVQGYNFNVPPTPLWIGDGINSSTAAAVATNQNDPYKTGIGYAEASALFTFPLPDPAPTWEGQVPDSTMVLVKYTFYGDANLDGRVNLQDFNRLAANFGTGSGAVWSQGDFHYDGNVNLQDFNRLAANFGQGTTAGTYDDYTTEELEEMLPD